MENKNYIKKSKIIDIQNNIKTQLNLEKKEIEYLLEKIEKCNSESEIINFDAVAEIKEYKNSFEYIKNKKIEEIKNKTQDIIQNKYSIYDQINILNLICHTENEKNNLIFFLSNIINQGKAFENEVENLKTKEEIESYIFEFILNEV